MYEVTMPKLSDSMTSGQIVEWKVKEGDTVSEGDVLAEIESDKATLDLECFTSGVVTKLLRGNGDEVPCGEVIATIASEDEAPAPARKKPAPQEEPEPEPPPAEEALEAEAPAEKAAKPRPAPEPSAPVTRHASRVTPGRIAISPYARMLAQQKGVDTTKLKGSGPGGRLVAADVEGAAAVRSAGFSPSPYGLKAALQTAAIPPSPDEELPPITLAEGEADVEDAPYRLKTQARIVTASKHVIPHFYMTRGADVTELLARKDEWKARFGGATVTHLIMLAAVKAIQANPLVNRSYDRGKIIKWRGIHLGLAVDTDQGLTVAVLRDAQDLSLTDIVERTKPLVEKARGGKLTAEERSHPTLTITNLGMFDVEHFAPIINPPSAITLGVASALPAPVVRGDAIFIAKLMRLTLSCDHRIIEGAAAARFLKTLKDLLEAPDTLLAAQE
ncbi:MAG TPA: dihydrolipoamide acetyltransferase family protein [Planctomycetota bacterium]|nr:dihydrolipoamide acetyltransferase family protein [Planctomycetota bacterium]